MIFKTIENLTHRQVILRLNSGKTLFIEPGTPSESLPLEELSNNIMVDKLLDRRIIAMHTEEVNTPVAPSKTKKTKKSGSKGGK